MKTFNNWVVENIQKQWESTGLLEHIPEERKAAVTQALEGQRLYNEFDDKNPQFNRISIPVVLRILTSLPEVNGSAEPLPEQHAFRTPIFDWKENYDEGGQYNLDKEAVQTAELAEKLAGEIKELAGDKELTIHSFSNEGDKVSMNYSLV